MTNVVGGSWAAIRVRRDADGPADDVAQQDGRPASSSLAPAAAATLIDTAPIDSSMEKEADVKRSVAKVSSKLVR